MNIQQQIAKHLRDVFLGGNWTVSNVKDQLATVTWEQATAKVEPFANTIAVLTYHIGYYVGIALKVLQGGALEGSDKFSFDCPLIGSQADWEALQNKVLAQAEQMAALVEQMPESALLGDFVDNKYGTYYRNIAGITEHTHYHLGQIAMMKKIVQQS